MLEFNMLNKFIKIYVLILFLLNYIVLKIINLYIGINIFNYFFYYLNKLENYNISLKYLIIKKVIYLLFEDFNINKQYYKFYFIFLYKKIKVLFYSKLRKLNRKFYVIFLNIILIFLNIYKKLLLKYKNKKKYKLKIFYFYIKFKKLIKKIYLYFIIIFKKYIFKIKLYIYIINKFILSIYLKSNIYYLLFFFFINIIEYLIYFIEKSRKIRLFLIK
jgi:hypothetical protein